MQNLYLLEQLAAERRTERLAEAERQRRAAARPAGRRLAWRGVAGAPAALVRRLPGRITAGRTGQRLAVDRMDGTSDRRDRNRRVACCECR